MSSSPSPLSRRSFSLPVPRNVTSSDPQLEILLPSVRIISFSTSSSSPSRPGSSNGIPLEKDQIGKLLWTSPYETIIAVGPLKIFRAPGSVAFLNCANALKPIMPKSQAWCVDGDRIFVLQVARPQYWRIEVSSKTDDEKAKIVELKRVLGEVLLFEKTPCPFQRDFEVELPEAPATPVTKRPWKPVQGPTPRPVTPLVREISSEDGYGSASFAKRANSASPLRQSLLASRRRNSAMDLGSHITKSDFETQPSSKLSTLSSSDFTTTISELDEPTTDTESSTTPPVTPAVNEKAVKDDVQVSKASGNDVEPSVPDLLDESDGRSDVTENTNPTPRPRGRSQLFFRPMVFDNQKGETQQAARPGSRSAAAPPLLSLITIPPSMREGPLSISSAHSDSNESFTSSVESFHTVHSWHSLSPTNSEPTSPKQPHSDDIMMVSKRSQHAREVSELTVTPESPRVWKLDVIADMTIDDGTRTSTPEPQTPTLTMDSDKSDEEFEIATPPAMMKQGLRHRTTTSSNSRRRELSPLPPAVNLFSPTRHLPRHLQTVKNLPIAIIQKTCEILLSPPSHLFHLMLSIASKLAAGQWRGVLMGHGNSVVDWDFEDEYATMPGRWEDDYGVDLIRSSSNDKDSNTQNDTTNIKAIDNNNGWEID